MADGLHSAAIHLLRRVRKQDVASGIGPAQLSALSVLVFAGPMTLGQLAAAEQVRPPTVTRIASALLRRRLIERVADPRDRRRVPVRATAAGTRLLQRGRRRRIAYLAAHLALLAPAQLRLLREAAGLLEEVLRNWQEKNKGGGA